MKAIFWGAVERRLSGYLQTKPFSVVVQLRGAGEPLHCGCLWPLREIHLANLGKLQSPKPAGKIHRFQYLIALGEILLIWLCWLLCVRGGGCLGDTQGGLPELVRVRDLAGHMRL